MSKASKTKSDKEYMTLAAMGGCIACRKDGRPGTPAQLHHPRSKAGAGERGPHNETYALCPMHHLTGEGGVVAVHLDPEAFHLLYGSDEELSRETMNRVIGIKSRTLGRRA